MIHLKKTIFSFLTGIFLIIGFLRILSPVFQDSPFDLHLRTLTLSASSYVFDKNHWFLGYRVTETDIDNKKNIYDLSYKNFGKKIMGGYERKDLIIHSVAWAPVIPKIFSQQVIQFYVCEDFYGVSNIKKIHYDFTYKGQSTGTVLEIECTPKDNRVE